MNFLNERWNVLVIGDIMLDRYIKGKLRKDNPESHTSPIIRSAKHSSVLGGAANVAVNLTHLGSYPMLCGYLGNDASGKEVSRMLKERGIDDRYVMTIDDRPTTTKTRVLNESDQMMQMMRIDDEVTSPPNSLHKAMFMAAIEHAIESERLDAVILQDYNKGVLHAGNIEHIIALARKRGLSIIVDPKKDNFFAYQNVDVFKPNLKETYEGLGQKVLDTTAHDHERRNLAKELQKRIKAQRIILTQGSNGLLIADKDNYHYSEAILGKFIDPCGAGDAVLAMACVCWLSDVDVPTTATMCNLSGSICCAHEGTYAPAKGEFRYYKVTT